MIGDDGRQVRRAADALDSEGNQLFSFTPDGTRACLGGIYPIVANETTPSDCGAQNVVRGSVMLIRLPATRCLTQSSIS